MHPTIGLILKYPETLLSRSCIIDYFVDSDPLTKEEVIEQSAVRPGKLFVENNKTHIVTEGSGKDLKSYEPYELPKDYKLEAKQLFTLEPGMIANHTEGKIETSIGRFLLNYILLVTPFGDKIPYNNDSPFSLSKLEKIVAEKLVDGVVKPEQAYRYIDNAYSLTSLNDFFVPSITPKSITSHPEVSKLRDELFEKYKDQMDDPNIMIKIEDELVKLDKEMLKGDPSNDFMIKDKNYDNHRKRMFLTIGAVPAFGDDQKQLSFSKTNLNEGWKLEELDILANDIRHGSYSRAKNTAKGGVIAKTMGRRFQDSHIKEDDCKTPRGIKIFITEVNKNHYLFRNLVKGGGLIELTADNINQYVGKEVEIRSPMHCQTNPGYCYACMDTRFKKVGIKMLNLAPTNIGSTLLGHSMKAMHHSKVSSFNLEDLNRFVV